ncbi:MAG: thioredoxin family protein [Planctomycetes bacterium]|jgi:hypothetical protein|nr:thioredoxin family protein [Planctomycetota bacterium]
MPSSLPLLCALLAPLQQAPQLAQPTVTLRRVAADSPSEVGSAQVPQPPFEPSADRRTAATTITAGGRSLRLEVTDPVASAPPALWIDADADLARDDGELLPLQWEHAMFADVDLRPYGIDAVMMLFRRPTMLRATVRTLYHFEGELAIDGATIGVRWIDMDASGAPSRGDRWLSLPQARLAEVMLPNSMFVAREADEPWHFGSHELRVDALAATVTTLPNPLPLRWQPLSEPRHQFLAGRNARVTKWFTDQFEPDRAAFEREHGIDATRPRAQPVDWYHTLEFADARRFAAATGKPLLVEFSRDGCEWCKRLPWATYQDAAVVARLQQFACVRIDTELDPDRTAEGLGHDGVPVLVLFDEHGKPLHALGGFRPPAEFTAGLDAALAKAGLPPVGNPR